LSSRECVENPRKEAAVNDKTHGHKEVVT